MNRIGKYAVVAATAALSLGVGATSASALVVFHMEDNGVPGVVAPPGALTNWATASLGIAAPGCTARYVTGVAPTGFHLVDVSGGSTVTAIKAGPMAKTGSCTLPANLGLSGTLKLTAVGGAPVSSTNNLWGV